MPYCRTVLNVDESRFRLIKHTQTMLLAVGSGLGVSALTVLRARALSAAAAPALTLHVYDHCPFCIRVELALGWARVPYKRVLYGYGDMRGPTALTGKKQLPVLEFSDGQCLPESLDIIARLGAGGVLDAHPLAPRNVSNAEVEEWEAAYKPLCRILTRPRILSLPAEVSLSSESSCLAPSSIVSASTPSYCSLPLSLSLSLRFSLCPPPPLSPLLIKCFGVAKL